MGIGPLDLLDDASHSHWLGGIELGRLRVMCTQWDDRDEKSQAAGKHNRKQCP
jgi:hypothetical protein